MADASIIDIGGVQWNVKDKEARDKIAILEEKTSANFEYSTEEKEIGKWLDNEKLYRLIIQGQATDNKITINLSKLNIKKITKMNGLLTLNTGAIMPIPYYMAWTSPDIGRYYAYNFYDPSSKNLGILFGDKNYYSNVNIIIELEYTKNE